MLLVYYLSIWLLARGVHFVGFEIRIRAIVQIETTIRITQNIDIAVHEHGVAHHHIAMILGVNLPVRLWPVDQGVNV